MLISLFGSYLCTPFAERVFRALLDSGVTNCEGREERHRRPILGVQGSDLGAHLVAVTDSTLPCLAVSLPGTGIRAKGSNSALVLGLRSALHSQAFEASAFETGDVHGPRVVFIVVFFWGWFLVPSVGGWLVGFASSVEIPLWVSLWVCFGAICWWVSLKRKGVPFFPWKQALARHVVSLGLYYGCMFSIVLYSLAINSLEL